MAPFYGWGSTASRLEPLWGDSLLFTTKFPEISGTQSIDLGRMKDWVDHEATQWFWTWDPWIGNPAPCFHQQIVQEFAIYVCFFLKISKHFFCKCLNIYSTTLATKSYWKISAGRTYSRKYGHACYFSVKGQNIWKLGLKCTKFESILKKGSLMHATITRMKQLEYALTGYIFTNFPSKNKWQKIYIDIFSLFAICLQIFIRYFGRKKSPVNFSLHHYAMLQKVLWRHPIKTT